MVYNPRVAVDWTRSMPWWLVIARVLPASLSLSGLLLIPIAAWLTSAGWQLGEYLFKPQRTTAFYWASSSSNNNNNNNSELAKLNSLRGSDARVDSLFQAATVGEADTIWSGGLMRTVWWRYASPFATAISSNTWSWRETSTRLFGLLWTTLVWGIVGGAIVRRGLVQLGTRTNVGWVSSLKFAVKRCFACGWSIAGIMLLILAFMSLPWLVGAISQAGRLGESIATYLLVFTAILCSVVPYLMACVLIGFPFLITAIMAEKQADAFEGIQRTAAYVLQRPLTVIVLVIVFGLIGSYASQIFNYLIAQSLAYFTASSEWGADGKILREGEHLVLRMAVAFSHAFTFQFFWIAVSGMYLIVRREVDNTEYDEIDLDEVGSPVAIPALKTDNAGNVQSPDSTDEPAV